MSIAQQIFIMSICAAEAMDHFHYFPHPHHFNSGGSFDHGGHLNNGSVLNNGVKLNKGEINLNNGSIFNHGVKLYNGEIKLNSVGIHSAAAVSGGINSAAAVESRHRLLEQYGLLLQLQGRICPRCIKKLEEELEELEPADLGPQHSPIYKQVNKHL